MTRKSLWMLVVLAFWLGVPGMTQRGSTAPPKLCEEVVTTLYPEWHSKLPRQKLARIEVRNCRVEDWGFLQIAAWNSDASEPSLVVDTKRSTIERLVMAGNVFVLETAGASSNVVQVVVYQSGRPQLVFSDATRGEVHIETTWQKVIVRRPQEGGPARVTEFPTGRY
jgi:hypothetical protein